MEILRKIVPGSALAPLFSLPRSSRDLKYEVIVLPFADIPSEAVDDGSLEYLFRNYSDDGVREPLTPDPCSLSPQ